jgi:hypothetical protein
MYFFKTKINKEILKQIKTLALDVSMMAGKLPFDSTPLIVVEVMFRTSGSTPPSGTINAHGRINNKNNNHNKYNKSIIQMMF